MDRDEFMELVYETFADEPDNVLANGIIEAADAYVEHEKAKLFSEDTTSDLISRTETVKKLQGVLDVTAPITPYDGGYIDGVEVCISTVSTMPPAQPEPKRGEWIYNSPMTMKCNQCGIVIKDWDWHRFKICPSCGADMRGEQDG